MKSDRFAFTPAAEAIVAELTPAELGLTPARVWNPSPSRQHRTEPYELPQALHVGIFGDELTAAKFSPPPLAVVLEDAEGNAVLVSVVADAGWHRFNGVDFDADAKRLRVTIDLEGRTAPADAGRHVRVEVLHAEPGESRHALLARGQAIQYPDAAGAPSEGPEWWRRPIYCGWGDQVATAHWLEGPGPELRALAYCIQGLYERRIRRLDVADVPFGTTIIDHGWSPAGSWQPDPVRWPDLKGFIAREHARGRRVLLWLATWLWHGLPDEWCVVLDDQGNRGTKLIADPTHPDYLDHVRNQVHDLLSPDGLDADGFKIDQLAYAPSQRHPRGGPGFGRTSFYDPPAGPLPLHGDGWGIELLHTYQKTIYDAAKQAKPDALITSSTVHPYFHDTFDMVRLHDTGSVTGDVIEAMSARADLARAALPGKPIDTDDWVHGDYARWLDYTMRSPTLGVPCLFYAERFMLNWRQEPTTKLIPLEDLRRIAAAWREAEAAPAGAGGAADAAM